MGHRGAGALPTTTQDQIAPAAAAARGAPLTTIEGPSVESPSVDGPDFPIRRSDTTPRYPPAGSAPVADVRIARASPTARQGHVPRALQDDAAPVVRRPWIRGEPLAVGASFHGTCRGSWGGGLPGYCPRVSCGWLDAFAARIKNYVWRGVSRVRRVTGLDESAQTNRVGRCGKRLREANRIDAGGFLRPHVTDVGAGSHRPAYRHPESDLWP